MRLSQNSRHSRCYLPRRGFTFVELCFGLVITALVMAAVASFTLATAQSWKYSEESDSVTAQARQAALRLNRLVQNSKLIGAVVSNAGELNITTPAAFILWIEDANGDGLIQGSECAMVEHDFDTRLLRYYPPGQGDSVTPLTWNVFISNEVLTNFRVGRTWQPLARNVGEARFGGYARSDSEMNPFLEYKLTLTSGGRSIVEYGTATVRAPAKQPL